MQNEQWVLVHSNGRAVQQEDKLVDRHGEILVVADSIGRPPHKPSSTGRIYVRDPDDPDGYTMDYFPSVFNCRWVQTTE